MAKKRKRQASLVSVVFMDFRGKLGFFLTLVGWLLYFANAGKDNAWIFLCVAIVATCVGVLVILSRVSFYQNMLDHGVRVPAHILSSVQLVGGRRRGTWIEYEYVYQDQTYHRSVIVPAKDFPPRLVAGDVTGLIINPDNPDQVFFEIYFI